MPKVADYRGIKPVRSAVVGGLYISSFPWSATFSSREEVDAYLSEPLLLCLLCGQRRKWLSGSHFTKGHKISEDDYKSRYGIPVMRALMCPDTLAKQRAHGLQVGQNLKATSPPKGQPRKMKLPRPSPEWLKSERRRNWIT